MKHFFCAGVITLLCCSLMIGCKKDNKNDTSPSNTLNGFLPNPGTYTYHVTSTDGTTGDETLTASAKRDSAGGQAVTILGTAAGFHLQATRFANATNTIEPIYPPSEFDELANTVRNQPGIQEFTYNGWPIYQTMPNTAAVNDVLSFTGGPIHLHWSTVSGPVDYTIAYLNGKVVASNQKVTVPAGTYTCSEWAYSTKVTTKAPMINTEYTYTDTLWMAPGVPFVKSSELTNNAYAVTTLTKVN